MPKARKCSRCESFYDDYHPKKDKGDYNALQLIDLDLGNEYYFRKTIDLCPACKTSFETWLNDPKGLTK